MSDKKLPKGASKWWNLPAEQLTKDQREIKRKYARDLYHKKKQSDEEPISLKRENAFLQSVIENYRIGLRNLFDNDMVKQRTVPSTATFKTYKKYALEEPIEILARDQDMERDALMALTVGEMKVIKFKKHCTDSCDKSFHGKFSSLNPEENIVEVRMPRYFDILYGFYAQGVISKVEILYNGGGSDFTAVEYGQYTGNHCHFQIPIPAPILVELRIRVTFSNKLHIERWTNGPKTILVIEGGWFKQNIRNKLGYGIANIEKTPSWPTGTPTDEYFCKVLECAL